ncbi:hypothetical protein LPJ64_003193 [Coemansia asiatica]|uniref:Zn(2)-C6 fungal-type domain-containing protein n=1 Tax=Coemansia asiatica TaxID=1052880 RepID=A0A9W7XLJ6_9FUNG|nr:hypothetical protein LPJ64_003193 [Coemansia asiatica]
MSGVFSVSALLNSNEKINEDRPALSGPSTPASTSTARTTDRPAPSPGEHAPTKAKEKAKTQEKAPVPLLTLASDSAAQRAEAAAYSAGAVPPSAGTAPLQPPHAALPAGGAIHCGGPAYGSGSNKSSSNAKSSSGNSRAGFLPAHLMQPTPAIPAMPAMQTMLARQTMPAMQSQVQVQVQVQSQYHYHPSPAFRADMRYWPYPPQMGTPAGMAPGYPYFVPAPPPPPPPPVVAAGASGQAAVPWRRERRSKACLRCHTKKIKCEGEGAVCDGCRQAGCECRWVEMKKRGPKPKANAKANAKAKARKDKDAAKNLAVAANSGSEAATALVAAAASEAAVAASELHAGPGAHGLALRHLPGSSDSDVRLGPSSSMDDVLRVFFSDRVAADTRNAVISYFDYFYGRIPIFHPASFVRRIVMDDVDPLLVDTMKAYTARAVMRHTGCTIDIEALTTSVRRRLLTGLDHPTVDYVRAVVLASALSGGESKFTSYNSLACLASSLVTRLGWHTLDLQLEAAADSEQMPWDQWVQLEIKRRTFWAVYQLDSYQSMLADRPLTIDPTRIYIATPGSDHSWDDITVPQILHWPTRHNPAVAQDTIVRTAALSYTFIELCNIMHIVCRMNDFLWSVKLSIAARVRGSSRSPDIPFLRLPPLPHPQPQPDRSDPVRSLFDYPEYRRIHESLLAWRDRLVPAELVGKSTCTPLTDFTKFGSTENRRFTMRVRYFCLRCYHTAIFLLLHFANRPSFFDPQQAARAKEASTRHRNAPCSREHSVHSAASTPTPTPTPTPTSTPTPMSTTPACEEDSVLRSLLSAVFSEMLNDGYLADDILDESWNICLDEIFAMVDHLDRNNDIPIDRCDASISFCLFTSITVLIRHVKKCRNKLAAGHDKASAELSRDLERSTAALRRMWTMLKDLGFIWTVKGMEHLLRSMQVEEIANAADMFSSLSL